MRVAAMRNTASVCSVTVQWPGRCSAYSVIDWPQRVRVNVPVARPPSRPG